MTKIVKTYSQQLPALRFIGKKYLESDRLNGSYAAKWGEWFRDGSFGVIEAQNPVKLSAVYEDGDAYIGLMRIKQNEPFEYWIGIFMPTGTPVPEGYAAVDFPASKIGVCWIKGPENEVYSCEEECIKAMKAAGYEEKPDDNGACWFFERYVCPRFTVPDENGEIILDICQLIK